MLQQPARSVKVIEVLLAAWQSVAWVQSDRSAAVQVAAEAVAVAVCSHPSLLSLPQAYLSGSQSSKRQGQGYQEPSRNLTCLM